MSGQIWGLLGVVLSVLGSIVVARLSARAQDKKAAADADVTSGRLALDIAQRAEARQILSDARIGKLEGWRRAVLRWGTTHDRWDRIVEEHLERADPAALKKLPPREPMPEMGEDE